jgi:eukaryotic-like serine/threonine-protein kinase
MSKAHEIESSADGVFLDIQSALAGRYSLIRELGRGGMAIVYLAHEVRLDRLVALKVLPAYMATPSLRERFQQEARTAAKLSHPNIVPIHAVDEAADFVFFAMAYVDGETLAQRIKRLGRLSNAEVAPLMRDVAQALAYAHRQGVVHRDIKPDNILIDGHNGRPMVADFGIAHLTSGGSNSIAGQLIGTPDFMSPEQATGDVADGRSDIYSLGLVGYQALSGELPFVADSLGSLLAQRISMPAPRVQVAVPTVSPRLAGAIDRCLATAPDARFQSGEALAEALDAAVERPRRLHPVLERWVAGVTQLPFAMVMFAPVVLHEFLGPLVFLADSFAPGKDPVGWVFEISLATGIAYYIGAPFVVYGVHRLMQVRRVRRAGFALEDFRLALASSVGAEAVRHASVSSMRRIRDASPGFFLAALGLAAFGKCTDQLKQNEDMPSWLVWIIITGIFLAIRLALKGSRSAEEVDLAARAYLWNRWPGAMVSWLAGIGVRAPASPVATHRRTEIDLKGAAVALFEALPRELRRDLPSVPDVIERLEERATALRRQVDELQQLENGDHSEMAFRRQRERAQRGLADVVASLERIRLGLLRLRAGAVESVEITDAIESANEVCRSLDALASGQAEVEQVLRGDPER